jgi:2,3-bisphosphoglycerate-independent phosphoglycerate mutase
MERRRVALIIRDGWGINHRENLDQWDATRMAATPHTDRLRRDWPRVEISASGLDVGLPDGIMGNSEVGHQNMGAGRVVDQEIVRIDKALADGSLEKNPVLEAVFQRVKNNRSKLHLLGLLSDGGVHSVMRHPIGLLRLAQKAGVPRVLLHAFMDGRDTPPKSGLEYMKLWQDACRAFNFGEVATVMGRFWAMDRDNRWDRVQRAYDSMLGIGGEWAHSPEEVLARYYENPTSDRQVGDEFIPPTQIGGDDEDWDGKISDGDGVIFFNFRGDRPREITRALTEETFSEFLRTRRAWVHYVTLTDYQKGLCPNVLFPKSPPTVNGLGEYISRLGLKQFRTAETEKYVHVTFFFNDYREDPFPGEDRRLVASPKDVATYDLRPEMSAVATCDGFLEALRSRNYDLLVLNFANPDMVGHTGNFEAAQRAVETVDQCLGKILAAADGTGTQLVITADHGNIEEMWDEVHGVPHTQHTTNPVELILYGSHCRGLRLRAGGRLADIAPTVLHLMGLEQPPEMTGKCLISRDH